MKSKIFINYRQEDSPWNSVALYNELKVHFGEGSIFKDFNTIAPGEDFADSIDGALETCEVLLVLMSEKWLTIEDKKGNKRIDNPDDFVRLEIATALKRNICVIPVLFDDIELPRADELPDDLKKLARRQAVEIDKKRFESDTIKLVEAIKRTLELERKKNFPGIEAGSATLENSSTETNAGLMESKRKVEEESSRQQSEEAKKRASEERARETETIRRRQEEALQIQNETKKLTNEQNIRARAEAARNPQLVTANKKKKRILLIAGSAVIGLIVISFVFSRIINQEQPYYYSSTDIYADSASLAYDEPSDSALAEQAFDYGYGTGDALTVTDVNGQLWLAKNLNVEYFRNGEQIAEVTSSEEWIYAINNGIPAWCYFNFDSGYGPYNGKLYNYFAVFDSRGLAPEGWHIPTIEELLDYPAGFAGLRGGFFEGVFKMDEDIRVLWSSTQVETNQPYYGFINSNGVWYSSNNCWDCGYYVVCIKDYTY